MKWPKLKIRFSWSETKMKFSSFFYRIYIFVLSFFFQVARLRSRKISDFAVFALFFLIVFLVLGLYFSIVHLVGNLIGEEIWKLASN